MFPMLKKASAVLGKADNSDDLNVFGEFVVASFENCVTTWSERRQREIFNASFWILE
jgi:hypothetical protein